MARFMMVAGKEQPKTDDILTPEDFKEQIKKYAARGWTFDKISTGRVDKSIGDKQIWLIFRKESAQ
ncbi:MAG: hypothetical protein KQH63_01090 [Desulfobulbaceae bacterium]|nr:hypothetical protein [Desulfobulbaceae bacterium]